MSRKRLIHRLGAGKVLVSDGAWGTALMKKGFKIGGECPELWCLDHPDVVFEIARSYVEAKADMIETNSFGGNRFRLGHYGLENCAAEINEAAARISRSAAGEELNVLGSMGPTGEVSASGGVSAKLFYEAFAEQAAALEKGGADTLCVETMYSIEEAAAAVRACKDNTRCDVICTFTFQRAPDGSFCSIAGVTPTSMTESLTAMGVDIIGTNCGNRMEEMVLIVKEVRRVNPDIPVLVHANAGLPRKESGRFIYPDTPESMGGYVEQLIEAGANIIGGCCGTTSAHIRAIGEVIRNERGKAGC